MRALERRRQFWLATGVAGMLLVASVAIAMRWIEAARPFSMLFASVPGGRDADAFLIAMSTVVGLAVSFLGVAGVIASLPLGSRPLLSRRDLARGVWVAEVLDAEGMLRGSMLRYNTRYFAAAIRAIEDGDLTMAEHRLMQADVADPETALWALLRNRFGGASPSPPRGGPPTPLPNPHGREGGELRPGEADARLEAAAVRAGTEALARKYRGGTEVVLEYRLEADRHGEKAGP